MYAHFDARFEDLLGVWGHALLAPNFPGFYTVVKVPLKRRLQNAKIHKIVSSLECTKRSSRGTWLRCWRSRNEHMNNWEAVETIPCPTTECNCCSRMHYVQSMVAFGMLATHRT